jgi:subtilisin family serine protease
MNNWIFRLTGMLSTTAVLCIGVSASAQAGSTKPAYVPGEALITVAAGTSTTQLNALAASVNAVPVRTIRNIDGLNRIDFVQLRLTKASPSSADTTDLVNRLRTNALVKFSGTNKYVYRKQTGTFIPNDPRFNEQWGMQMINMPTAWTIERGKANVVIAVIDDGVDRTHPDLAARTLPGFNAVTGANNGSPVGNDTHGTHCAGIAAAITNNGVGVAGVAADNVRILPVNVFNGSAGAAQSDVIAGWNFIGTFKDQNSSLQVCVNASIGHNDTSDDPNPADPEVIAIRALTAKGVPVIVAAGNDALNGNPPDSPSNIARIDPLVFCVTAVGRTGVRSSYSQFRPTTTVAAPGGDMPNDVGILSTLSVAAGSYGFQQGTSMAAPHVTGAVGLLLSVPGVSPSNVRSVIQSTAKPVPGATIPSPEYGTGILDVEAALKAVAVGVAVSEPTGTGGKLSGTVTGVPLPPIESLRPTIRIKVNRIQPADVVLNLDQRDISSTYWGIQNAVTRVVGTTTVYDSYDIVLPKDSVTGYAATVDTLAPGQHKVIVTGTYRAPGGTPSASDPVFTDQLNFTVEPYQVKSGRSMISIPYFQAGATPEIYFGTGFTLTRWLPDQAIYAFYTSFGVKNLEASFAPPSLTSNPPRPDGSSTPQYPVGIAFWSDVESIKPVLTRGAAATSTAFRIPLRGSRVSSTTFVSWNMVGDPFPFNVPFSACIVETSDGRRFSTAEAAAQGLILPNIYTYDGGSGYQFATLPDGVLKAWNGHWIGVTSKSDLTLIVPPASVGSRAAASSNSTNGWRLMLSASTRNLRDSNVYIGVDPGANSGRDKSDVLKPPSPANYVSVAVDNSDWAVAPGRYAQDLRTGTSQSWNVVVDTDQKDADITLSWQGISVPKSVRLSVTDTETGQTWDVRGRSGITFHTTQQTSARKFVFTAKTAVQTALRVHSVAVRSTGRATGATQFAFNLTGDANVELKVLSGSGTPIGTIATRSASAGEQSVMWTGRDDRGRAVPAGTYLLQIRATGPDGESVRVVQPFALVR